MTKTQACKCGNKCRFSRIKAANNSVKWQLEFKWIAEFRCLRKYIGFHKRKMNKESGNILIPKLIKRDDLR